MASRDGLARWFVVEVCFGVMSARCALGCGLRACAAACVPRSDAFIACLTQLGSPPEQCSGVCMCVRLAKAVLIVEGLVRRKRGRGAPAPCAAHTGVLCPHALALRAQIKPFVSNADVLLRWSKRLLPEALVHGIVKRTFFAHFCGGAPPRFIFVSIGRSQQCVPASSLLMLLAHCLAAACLKPLHYVEQCMLLPLPRMRRSVAAWIGWSFGCGCSHLLLGPGETQEQMQPVLKRLHANGIGSILDYAAEVRCRLACLAAPERSGCVHAARPLIWARVLRWPVQRARGACPGACAGTCTHLLGPRCGSGAFVRRWSCAGRRGVCGLAGLAQRAA